MAGPPSLPFFRSSTVSLYEIKGTMRVVQDRQVVLALEPWRLLDVRAEARRLILRGAFEGDPPTVRTVPGVAPEEAAVAADAIALRYALPKPLTVITPEELEKNARAYDGRFIQVTGGWPGGFVSGARLTRLPPHDRSRNERLTVRGILRCDGAGVELVVVEHDVVD